MNHSDPSGLWSTEAHNQIIWNALRPCGVTPEDIWLVQQGSAYADSDVFQGDQYSYMHAMSNGTAHQSSSSAQNQTAAFVAAQMHVAANQYASGVATQAMFSFGVAMHPLMDMLSPAHTNVQGHPNPWCGFTGSCSNTLQHGGDSWYPQPSTIEDRAHLNSMPEAQELANFMIRNWYQVMTGTALKCCSKQ